MKEITIIDGNYWMFSAYYGTASMGNLMVNHDGIPTNAVYGFANMLEVFLKKDPEYIMVAFDAKGKTFRSELLEQYKGHRKETPKELVCQFPMIREYLDAHNVAHYELTGYEGDDILGTIAQLGKKQGFKVNIVTNDKDMLQLVDDNVSVIKKNIKTKAFEEVTPSIFFDKYGLVPDQMRDLLGLMGDSADNIPGIAGVGEKTALKLLTQYKSVEGLQQHMDEIKGKMGEKIRDQIETGLLSKQLATIKTDVPVEFTIEQARYTGYQYESLANFYRTYDMQSLLKRISLKKEVVPTKSIEVQMVKTLPTITMDSALFVGTYDENYHKSPILGFGIYNEKQAFYISLQDASNDPAFLSFIQNENIKKYAFDSKKASLACLWHGLEIKGIDFDLQLASYVLTPSLKSELKSVCEYYEYYDVQYDEEVYGKGAKKKIPDQEILANHLVQQARAIYTLYPTVIKKLKEEEVYELYYDVEMPVARILAKMEYAGTKVDVSMLQKNQQEFKEMIENLENEIYALAGTTFNISSPKQLGEILFDRLGLPHAKKTKTGYSTAVDVLEKLQPIHPIVDKVLQYRMITKLNSTYVIGLQEQIFVDGKIHTIYNQALTQTGRLSSIEPNLQNIPVKSEEGRQIRKAFIPSNDYLVSFDYSQIELRVLAHLANATSLIEAFNQKLDIHTYTASRVFQVSMEEVDSTMRRHAKAINFGIIYGMSDFGLSKQIDRSLAQCKEFIEAYFTMYPEIRTYMDQNIQSCKKDGFVSTILNRKRYIPQINDKAFMVQDAAKRLAMNSPIQGSAADILKLAMIQVDELLQQRNLQSKMILQVHDELIFDVVKEELEEVMEIVEQGMRNAYPMQVELLAQGTYGKNWYELK